MLLQKYFVYHTYYLQIFENHFILRLLETTSEYQAKPAENISSKSLLVSNMREAKKLLKSCESKLSQGFSFTKPLIVIHPSRILKEKMADIEKKLYKELASVIKARMVIFHLGEELTFKALQELVDDQDSVEV